MTTDNEIWVFLSHSQDDYDKVRRVRDLLENDGFRPIMFFLKAFKDHPDDEMLKTLLRNEIDARKRFILCKSEHTDPPQGWVRFEVDYIMSKDKDELQNYYFQIVDINLPNDLLVQQLDLFRRNSTAFISCSLKDEKIYSLVKSVIESSLDMKVFDFNSLLEGNANIMRKSIDSAVSNGIYVAVVTNNCLSSDYVLEELEYAKELIYTGKGESRVYILCHRDIDRNHPNFKRFETIMDGNYWMEFSNETDLLIQMHNISFYIRQLAK